MRRKSVKKEWHWELGASRDAFAAAREDKMLLGIHCHCIISNCDSVSGSSLISHDFILNQIEIFLFERIIKLL